MATNSHSGATVKALADVELSERDVRNLAAAFLSLKEPISGIDYDVFTTVAGHVNVVNARKRFSEIKKKAREAVFGTASPNHVFSEDGGPKAATAGVKKSRNPAKATARKRKAADGSDDEADTTPARKVRARPAKTKPTPAVSGDDNEDTEVSPKMVESDIKGSEGDDGESVY